MRIESARDLKAELLDEFLQPEPATARLAVGIAPGRNDGDYKIAVRVTNANEAVSRVVESIIKRAAHEADVRVMGPITMADPDVTVSTAPPLAVGAPVAHYRSAGGTLGFFARRLRDGAIGFVSCNHVIADHDNGVDGDEIVRPYLKGHGSAQRDVIAYLDGAYPRLRLPLVDVDCAFAQLARHVAYEPVRLGPRGLLRAGVALPTTSNLVEKIGRTTGHTTGRITAFDLDDVEIPYDFGMVLYKRQIEIESTNEHPFSRPGDSGALVFTEGQPLGLICASSRAGGAGNTGYTYANPISTVLSTLNVEILT